MYTVAAVLSILVSPLVLLARADGPFTLSLTSVPRTTGYLQGLPAADQARAAAFRSGSAKTVPATNLDYVQYTTSVGVGSPPTYYNLVVDTGSSNTFVGTGKTYVRTSTSIPTGQNVTVTYGSGFFRGVEYLDQVTLAEGLVIKNQSIGDALKWADFPGVDGIVGVGPQILTVDTLSPDVDKTIPTVMDNALAQKLISEEVLGVSFAPAYTNASTNGALTFGGVDSSLYIGQLQYVPVTDTEPSSYYWGVNVSYAVYGSSTVIPWSTAGIVDTGTTQVLLADDFLKLYMDGIPGSYVDNDLGVLVISNTSSVPDLQPLTFHIGGYEYVLDSDAQLVPEWENEYWGGEPGVRYGIVGPLGGPSGFGLDIIIGQKFMERYYAVFDKGNRRVGFAATIHTLSK